MAKGKNTLCGDCGKIKAGEDTECKCGGQVIDIETLCARLLKYTKVDLSLKDIKSGNTKVRCTLFGAMRKVRGKKGI